MGEWSAAGERYSFKQNKKNHKTQTTKNNKKNIKETHPPTPHQNKNKKIFEGEGGLVRETSVRVAATRGLRHCRAGSANRTGYPN